MDIELFGYTFIGLHGLGPCGITQVARSEGSSTQGNLPKNAKFLYINRPKIGSSSAQMDG